MLQISSFKPENITNNNSYSAELRNIGFWIRLNTPQKSIVLSPPIPLFKVFTQRDTIYDVKQGAVSKEGSIRFINKLIDYNGNNRNFKKSYAMFNQINTVYYKLPPSYLLKLGEKYKANYIVHHQKT